MRIALCGQRTFGKLVLEMLLSRGEDVALVSAPAEDSRGRPDKLFNAAARARLPYLQAGELRAHNMPVGVDLVIAAHSHDYLSAKTLAATKLGAVGYHPSLLPRHRGRDAVRWAVKMGDPVTGGTVYWLNENVDGGPIAKQDWCWILPGETARDLYHRSLQAMGVRLLSETLDDIAAGRLVMVDQDERAATWEPSWGRAPLFRPDLPRLGAPPEGYEVVKNGDAAISGSRLARGRRGVLPQVDTKVGVVS